jgi:hypothetical protein
MIPEEVFQKAAEGDQTAIMLLDAAVTARTISQPETAKAMKAITEAVIGGKGDTNKLFGIGSNICETYKNLEARDMYEKLFMLAAYPVNPIAYVSIIGVGAAAVRINKGEVGTFEVDKEWYLKTARICLVRAIRPTETRVKLGRGMSEAECKKKWGMSVGDMEQNLVFVIEALRNLDGPEIKGGLVSIIQNGFGNTVKCAAGQSIGPIRIREELSMAKTDREFLLASAYPDPTGPQSMYVECIFSAVETAYSPMAGGVEMAIAIKQLSSFGARGEVLRELFDADSLTLITRNVENALLHALMHPDAKIREGAASGLQSIGSDRVEDILDRIVARVGQSSETGALASEALATIRGGKVEVLDDTFRPPRKASMPPPPPTLRPKSAPTSNINQA